METQENTNVTDSALGPLLHMVHFYASMVAGWWAFHNGIYPMAYFAKSAGASLSAQLPIYALNTMAFGCMAYVITRPLALFLIELMRAFEKAVIKLSVKR
jgi:hypothetical protein